jgi:hypothetical protein
MPVPGRFNYDAWLGSTPYVYYTFDRVHSQDNVTGTRPGWLRMEQFGAGMITGWGVHHIDIAHWGMGAEYTGPLEAECVNVDFPKSGLWNVHGDFEVKMKYANDVTMIVNGKFPNGIRFEGTKGWIFCTRSGGGATSTDPAANARSRGIDASDPKILESVIGPNEIHLYESPEQTPQLAGLDQIEKTEYQPDRSGAPFLQRLPGGARGDEDERPETVLGSRTGTIQE